MAKFDKIYKYYNYQKLILNSSMNFSTFFYTPKSTHMCVLFYLARHVVATHLEHLQLVPNLLKIFGTPSSIFVQLG